MDRRPQADSVIASEKSGFLDDLSSSLATFRLRWKSEKSTREGFPIFVADGLKGVKWKNRKTVPYNDERDWRTPPMKA